MDDERIAQVAQEMVEEIRWSIDTQMSLDDYHQFYHLIEDDEPSFTFEEWQEVGRRYRVKVTVELVRKDG